MTGPVVLTRSYGGVWHRRGCTRLRGGAGMGSETFPDDIAAAARIQAGFGKRCQTCLPGTWYYAALRSGPGRGGIPA